MTPLATEGVRNADSMQKTRCQTPLSPSEINNLIEALHQGVTPATGCTEPIALAYAAARAKRALGSDAKQLDSLHIDARVSPNIMKNGMAVMVPGTGRPGLEIAAAVGALAGNPDAGLAVLADVSEDAAEKARHLVDSGVVELTVADVDDDLYAETVLHLDGHHARACIAGDHTNVFLVSRDDEVLESKERPAAGHVPPTAALLQGLSLAKIYDFATTVDIELIEFITEAERLNNALVDAGRDGSYGIGEGAAILGSIDRGMASDDLCTRMTAYTAAASDARMGGAPFAGNDQQWIRQPRHRRHRPSHCRRGLRRCRPRTARTRPGPLSRRRPLRPRRASRALRFLCCDHSSDGCGSRDLPGVRRLLQRGGTRSRINDRRRRRHGLRWCRLQLCVEGLRLSECSRPCRLALAGRPTCTWNERAGTR